MQKFGLKPQASWLARAHKGSLCCWAAMFLSGAKWHCLEAGWQGQQTTVSDSNVRTCKQQGLVGCEPRSDMSGLTDAESMWQPSLAMEINGKGGAKSAVSALPKTVRKLNLAWGC